MVSVLGNGFRGPKSCNRLIVDEARVSQFEGIFMACDTAYGCKRGPSDRNPMDVAHVLNEVYSGIYSSMNQVRSLQLESYSDANIPKDLPNTLYRTYTQEPLSYEPRRKKLHDSVSHAVVAITRHTASCVYYTDDVEDAISRFIILAVAASENKRKNENAKMVIRNKDKTIMNVLTENRKQYTNDADF
ncbi:hypothetical protein EVAR_76258_1 [Eumeta japonica]|uniref:Uncharacterized protein n=1 Tax=Eumeta variegata TaxID=151549 RepID=A0A4C1UNW1_EUMVA|nr:hypothetical protein EVAR_76258_1 [Eumeta japonica]